MDRSTPGKVARAERAERASPYARPAASNNRVKRSSSMITFPAIRSLVSYITHPFARSPSSRGLPMTQQDIDIDRKSESGSEDGWNGEPSQQMKQGDIFEADEKKGMSSSAEKWKAMGEISGGKRDTARKNLQITAGNDVEPPLKSPHMPGHLARSENASPTVPIFGGNQPLLGFNSAPSIGNAMTSLGNSLQRRLSPTKAERPAPARSPVPPATPSVRAPPLANEQSSTRQISASSAALKAYLNAKDGQVLSDADLQIIERLTENAKHESELAYPTQSPNVETGGWEAGNFTPRPVKALPSSYTPSRPAGSAFGTFIPGGPGFSMGLSPSKATPANGTPGSVRYIGPGWSAKRMYPQKKSNIKPLFKFNLGDEGIAKKRKISEFEVGVDEDVPPVPPLPKINTMPNLASSSVASSPRPPTTKPVEKPTQKSDPVSVGKRRAADIMLDLINAEMADPKETASPAPFITNPYHPDAYALVSDARPIPSGPSTPASPAQFGTPRKSILRSSTGGQTPLRGAAKRLEEAKNAAPTPRKMTTLEMLADRSAAERDQVEDDADARYGTRSKGKGKHVRLETPDVDMETEDDGSEVEDLVQSHKRKSGDVSSKAQTDENADVEMASPPRRAREKEPEPEPFKPYQAPQLSSSNLPLPSSPSASKPKSTPAVSFTPPVISKPNPAPKFTPSPLSQITMPEEPKFTLESSSSSSTSKSTSIPFAPFKASTPKDFSSIYLSAKDTALAVAKEALPFFTFFTTADKTTASESTKRAKEEAMKRPIEQFEFTLDVATSGSDDKKSTARPWTCDLCMLSNPATALEQCVVCEAPKPAAEPLPTVSSSQIQKSSGGGGGGGGFDWSAATGGQKSGENRDSGSKWTCGTCMLQNPESEKEKCGVCETPRG